MQYLLVNKHLSLVAKMNYTTTDVTAQPALTHSITKNDGKSVVKFMWILSQLREALNRLKENGRFKQAAELINCSFNAHKRQNKRHVTNVLVGLSFVSCLRPCYQEFDFSQYVSM